jgi:ELWxxDGT repeat protein
MRKLIKFCTFLLLSSCTNPFNLKGATAISSIVFSPAPPRYSQKIYLDLTTATITEGSVIILNVAVDSIKSTDTDVTLALTSSSTFTRFNPIPAQITIPAGQLSKGIILNTIDDSISQGTETWTLTAIPVDPSVGADPGQLTITLVDNDSGGTTPATAGLAQLKEFNPLPENVTSINFKNKVFFANEEAAHGKELWVSDGTSMGTTMLKDIEPGLGASNPSNFYIDANGNYLYFTARTAAEGLELWRTDGTEAGTIMLSDIEPGAADSDPSILFKDGNLVYFSTLTTLYGYEIWVSDGTVAGTHLLKDIEPGNSNLYNIGGFIKWNSKVYFGVSLGGVSIYSSQIWETDGTSAGTAMAFDKIGATTLDYFTVPSNFVILNSKLVFSAATSAISAEIFATTNATNAGSYLLKDINSGFMSSYSKVTNYSLASGNYVAVSFDSDTNPGFYLTDGTAAGTQKILAGATPVSVLGMINGNMIFSGTGSTGQELWSTDGTIAGTVLLKDIYPGSTSGTQNSSSPSFAAQIGNKIFFTATTATEGTELWVTDGTVAGTVLLNDIYAGASSSSPKNFAVVGGQLYFRALSATAGSELWVSDGTPSGTRLFKDINPGSGSSGPIGLLSVNNNSLFFAAYNPSVNFATVYVSDLTSSGTVGINHALVHSLNTETKNFVSLNGKIYFDAMEQDGGNPLWVSDGTAAGTSRIADLDPNVACSDINYLTAINGSLFFRATDELHGSEIFVSDGTSAGTSYLKDIEPGTKSSNGTSSFIGVPNNNIFFSAGNAATGSELWVTDGTSGNTRMVADTNPGTNSNVPQLITPIPGTNSVIFYGLTGSSTYQIFTSDGTSVTTVAGISNLNSGITFYPNSTGILIRALDNSTGRYRLYQYDAVAKTATLLNPTYTTDIFNAVGGYFNRLGLFYYFTYNSADNSILKLWKTDGTVAGTVVVTTLPNVGTSYGLNFITDIGSKLVFSRSIYGASPVDEIWATDGTAVNTTMIKSVTSSSFTALLVDGGKLYFNAGSASEGTELWMTDGTTPGTFMLKDINPGTGSSSVRNLIAFNGSVYFSADDGVHGAELWVTDGTPSGTNLLYDINPGVESSSPTKFKVNGSKLFFLATKVLSGTEVWVYSP